MITIYGTPRTSAGRCYWCLEEIGLPYESKKINMREREHKSPEYLKINPNGKVPTLIDGQTIIWESMAINFFLAENYKQDLLGKNIQEKGSVYQWSFWSVSELQPPLIEIFIQKVFVPEDRRDPLIIEKSQKKIPALLEILNLSLEGKEYLAGTDFTLADLNSFSVVSICKSIQFDLSPYKNINQWIQRMTNRPAYQRFQEMCL